MIDRVLTPRERRRYRKELALYCLVKFTVTMTALLFLFVVIEHLSFKYDPPGLIASVYVALEVARKPWL